MNSLVGRVCRLGIVSGRDVREHRLSDDLEVSLDHLVATQCSVAARYQAVVNRHRVGLEHQRWRNLNRDQNVNDAAHTKLCEVIAIDITSSDFNPIPSFTVTSKL